MSESVNKDTELVLRYRGGDESAFEEIVERYRERTFWIAYNIVNNTEEARDISQEAFIRVFRSLHRFDTNRNFYTWLYRIVVNLCIDFLRRRGSNSAVNLDDLIDFIPAGEQPEAKLEAQETAEKVRAVLNTLPAKYKAVMALRDINGFSCKEISKILKCSHATVRWRLHRARKIFREVWDIRNRENEYLKNEVF